MRLARLIVGMSQQELAALMGVSDATVGAYESASRDIPADRLDAAERALRPALLRKGRELGLTAGEGAS